MEIRVLEYFLAIAREQSISGAASYLHISQPTLSRQIKDLELELGKPLFIRGNRKITLSEEGMLLRRRAEEIISLTRKAEKEVMDIDKDISGDINIGAGETSAISFIAETIDSIRKKHPSIMYNLSSDDAQEIFEQLDKGLIEFGVILGNVDKTKYEYLTLPTKDVWGILMRKDSPLADKEYIIEKDIEYLPLLISRQVDENHILSSWLSKNITSYHIVATYNLLYNASVMVSKGNGYALTIDNIINTSGDSNLCFKPLYPNVETNIYIIWKKYQKLSKATEAFLHDVRYIIDEYNMKK